MLKVQSGYRMPTAVDKFEIFPASLGGGIIMNLYIGDRVETMCFPNAARMQQVLFAMLEGPNRLGAVSPVAPPASEVKSVNEIDLLKAAAAEREAAAAKSAAEAQAAEAPKVSKPRAKKEAAPVAAVAEEAPVQAPAEGAKKRGRPKLSEEEKAANRARREAMNGTKNASEKLPASAEDKAGAPA